MFQDIDEFSIPYLVINHTQYPPKHQALNLPSHCFLLISPFQQDNAQSPQLDQPIYHVLRIMEVVQTVQLKYVLQNRDTNYDCRPLGNSFSRTVKLYTEYNYCSLFPPKDLCQSNKSRIHIHMCIKSIFENLENRFRATIFPKPGGNAIKLSNFQDIGVK